MKGLRGFPWRMWLWQTLAVVRLEFSKSLFRKRALWVYGLALAPVLLMTLHAIFMPHARRFRCTIGRDTMVFAGLFQLFILRLSLFFGCAGIFANLFRGEILDRSLHYYLLVPVRREVLAVGKYLSGWITATVCFGLSTALSFLVLFSHFGAGVFRDFLFDGPGLQHLGGYVGVTALACAGYGAIFLTSGLLFRNPMIPAAAVMVWEGMNPILPSALKKISIIFYLKSLSPVEVQPKGPLAFFALANDPMSPALAIPGMLAVAVALVAAACLLARRMEISYGTE